MVNLFKWQKHDLETSSFSEKSPKNKLKMIFILTTLVSSCPEAQVRLVEKPMIIAYLSTLFSGFYARVPRGETYLQITATGKTLIVVFAAGEIGVFGRHS